MEMVDAHIDAHPKEFDLNPNLQVGVWAFHRSKSHGRRHDWRRAGDQIQVGQIALPVTGYWLSIPADS